MLSLCPSKAEWTMYRDILVSSSGIATVQSSCMATHPHSIITDTHKAKQGSVVGTLHVRIAQFRFTGELQSRNTCLSKAHTSCQASIWRNWLHPSAHWQMWGPLLVCCRCTCWHVKMSWHLTLHEVAGSKDAQISPLYLQHSHLFHFFNFTPIVSARSYLCVAIYI